MTRYVTAISKCSLAAVGLALIATPVAAQDNDEVVRDRNPDMKDVAITPIRDLNLAKDKIPEVLVEAERAPYVTDGLDSCPALENEIAGLDRVLGADLDVDTEERDDINVGKIAKSAVGSLIPFRGIIREVTGAADHQRDFEEAIFAGAVRRGFLKGLGQQRGCAYPARPAFTKVKVTKEDRIDTEQGQARVARQEERGEDGTVFVSEPQVQDTND